MIKLIRVDFRGLVALRTTLWFILFFSFGIQIVTISSRLTLLRTVWARYYLLAFLKDILFTDCNEDLVGFRMAISFVLWLVWFKPITEVAQSLPDYIKVCFGVIFHVCLNFWVKLWFYEEVFKRVEIWIVIWVLSLTRYS